MVNTTVFCLTTTIEQAERIVTFLKADRFRGRDISVVLPDKSEISRPGRCDASGGDAVGGLTWLARSGQLAIPGIGLLIASGPIMAAMAGAAVIGSGTGAVTEVLAILGMPELQASYYEEQLRNGYPLIGVRTDGAEKAAVAKEIFIREGARDIVHIEDDRQGYDSAA